MPRKTKAIEFPAECCGVCKFCHQMPEVGLSCFAYPPHLFNEDDGSVSYLRGVQVEPTDHICAYFSPKHHS